MNIIISFLREITKKENYRGKVAGVVVVVG